MSKNINFWKLVRAGFHAILTCGPIKTSFQVDIEIYEDKLGQSGDRIFSSHITKCDIFHVLVLQEYWGPTESRIPLKPVPGGVRIVALSISSHEQTQ